MRVSSGKIYENKYYVDVREKAKGGTIQNKSIRNDNT